MGEGFIGDITKERRIVAALILVGIVLMLVGLDAFDVLDCRAEMDDDGGLDYGSCDLDTAVVLGFVSLLGLICFIAGLLLIEFSVLRTTGRNGEWLWFAYSIGLPLISLLYYVLDWMESSWVEGA